VQRIDTQWLAPISLLRSDRWLVHYSTQIDKNYGLGFANVDPSLYAVNDYQYFRENPLRADDTSAMLKHWLRGGGLEDSPMYSLAKLGDKFLKWKDDRFEVKTELLDSWLALISKVDPSWILASRYADNLYEDILAPDQLTLLQNSQCPLALSSKQKKQDVADNHVHLGGNGHTALSMLDIVLYMNTRPKRIVWPAIPEMTLLNSGSVDVNSIPLLINMLFQNLFSLLSTKEQIIPFQNLDMTFWKSGDGNLFLLENVNYESVPMQLLKSAILTNIPAEHRWLLLTTAMVYAVKYCDFGTEFRAGFNAFVHATNIFRSAMIFSGVGLSNFVDCFEFELRKPQQNNDHYNYENTALFRDGGINTYREFKAGPNIVLTHKGRGCVLDVQWFRQIAAKLIDSGTPENRHFVIHFFRSFPYGANENDKLQAAIRELMLRQTRVIQQFFNSLEMQACTVIGENYEEHTINLSHLIRGLDVAGNENHFPIEIFSPYIRVLRSGHIGNDSIYYKRQSKLHLTIHAGEDYAHILSGLRAIDETVQFCDYQTGDRIGHGLALGVDPLEWAYRQERIYLTASEHLDNLVWLYEKALAVIKLVPRFSLQLYFLENKIGVWSEYVYGENLSPQILFDAWKLRRNCPIIGDLKNHAHGTEWEFWVPDFEQFNRKDKSQAYQIWKRYLDAGQLSCAGEKHFDLVSIEFSSTDDKEPNLIDLTDAVSSDALELITAVQDLMIEEYSQGGLIMEACPTSNVSIGRLNKYKEHPIFRWNPPCVSWLDKGEVFNRFGIRKGILSVCVNTDDSAIMPTTIENEHRVLKETAVRDYQVSVLDAENWINNIRDVGVKIFNENHRNWVFSNCGRGKIAK
jgi:hypothetical protein